MKRRDAVSYLSLLTGGSIMAGSTFLAGCSPKETSTTTSQNGLLNAQQIALLDEVGDTILPTTASSPGAKAARIGEYMNIMMTDCASENDQQIFVNGLAELTEKCDSEFDKNFSELNVEQRTAFLMKLEEENNNYNQSKKEGDPEFHYYSMIKQLTIQGYFSSEIGATQALQYDAIPGKYDGCIPLDPDQKAYA